MHLHGRADYQALKLDIQNLYEGKFRWVKVPFPEDSVWQSNEYKSYTNQLLQYWRTYNPVMPYVPALMTYCEWTESDVDWKKNIPMVRISYISKVLKPIKWVIHFDHDGLPAFNGNEAGGDYTIKMETKKTVKFNAGIEFTTNASISGVNGPVQGSIGLKSSAGTSWEKVVDVVTIKEIKVEQGCNYQFTHFYAKLLCEVIHAREGEFCCSNSRETVITSASEIFDPPKLKSIDALSRLYHAFGKNVALHQKGKFFKGKTREIKMVVDPADSMLYITSRANEAPIDLPDFPAGYSGVGMDDNMHSVSFYHSFLRCHCYFGLNGKDVIKEDTEITYSPGNLVKVWEVAVKA